MLVLVNYWCLLAVGRAEDRTWPCWLGEGGFRCHAVYQYNIQFGAGESSGPPPKVVTGAVQPSIKNLSEKADG